MKQHNQTKTIHLTAYHAVIAELRQARIRSRLTQAEAGIVLGRSRQWIHKVETCEIRLDVVQLVQLSRLYGIRAHDLVRRLEEES